MGVFAGDIDDLFTGPAGTSSSDEPLGTRVRGRGGEGDIDAIVAVRELREHR